MTKENFSIDSLVDNLTPVSPLKNARLYILCSVMLMAGAFFTISTFGLRVDFAESLYNGTLVWKIGIFVLLAISAFMVVLSLSRPDTKPEKWHAVPALLGLGILIWQFYAQDADMISINRLMMFSYAIQCITTITIGGLVAYFLMWKFWLVKTASTKPARLAMVSGFLTSSLMAAAYSLHCNQDSALYILVYYVGSVAVIGLFGRLIGAHTLKW